MPLYEWSDSPVSELNSRPTKSGHWEAVVALHPNANPDSVSKLHAALQAKHIQNFMHVGADKSALILPDITNEQELLSILKDGEWTHSAPKITAFEGDKHAAKKGIKSLLEEQPLLMSSLFFGLADLSWIISGIQRGKHNIGGKMTKNDMSELLIGVTMGCSDVLVGVFGEDKSKPPMLAFADALTKHLQESGVQLPSGNDITQENLRKSGAFGASEAFLREHVVGVKALVKSAGGALMIHSALKKDNRNNGKLAAGMMLIGGWLPLLALDKPKAGPFEFKADDEGKKPDKDALGWFAENPRARITSPLMTGNNIAKLWGAYGESQRFGKAVNDARGALTNGATPDAQAALHFAEARQYDYAWNVLASCSNIVGNYIFGLSGKKKESYVKSDPERFHEEMLAVASNIMANVPENARQLAMKETASYIAGIKGVSESPEEIVAMISAESERLHHANAGQQAR